MRVIRRARGPLPELLARPETTAEQALQQAGVSERLLDGFFRPFFGGVLLDRELQTSSRMLEFLVRMFARGPAVIPARGMGTIAGRLAADLPAGALRLEARVRTAAAGEVELDDGARVTSRATVIAAAGPEAARLLDAPEPPSRASTTLYFAADRPVIDEPVLVLDGEGAGPVNSVAMLSVAAPGYAPPGQALMAVAAVGDHAGDDLETRARSQLERWFGTEVHRWRHLHTYRIPHALPAQTPPWTPAHPVRLDAGFYVCGDHRDTASIEGAVVSGWRAAGAVLADLT